MRSYQLAADTPPEATDDLIQQIVAAKLAAEAEAVGAMLSAPLYSVSLAVASGLTADLFDDDDLRVVYLAAVLCADAERLVGDPGGDRKTILLLARSALMGSGLWHVRLPEALATVAASRPGFLPGDVLLTIYRLKAAASSLDELKDITARLTRLQKGAA